MNWDLQVCAWRGHATYAPDEPALRDRLCTDTAVGEAWRCLRCESFVVGSPRGSGPAEAAPIVPRGRLLRDQILLRVLAVDRGARAIVMAVLVVLVLRFAAYRQGLQAEFAADFPLLQPFLRQIGWNVEHSAILGWINEAFALSPTILNLLALALAAYAAILAVEAAGLWLFRRWGEYFSVIATSVFLPLEIRELLEHVTVLRVLALLVNLAAVAWLLVSKRLFGIRGGEAAYRAERQEASLLGVEHAAAQPAPEHDRESTG